MRCTKRSLPYALVVLCALGAIVGTLTLLDAEKPRDASAAAAEIVPVEIVLLVDTSGSVDEFEYQLQQAGYAEAFRNEELTTLIESQGGIAVAYIEWSSVRSQFVRIDWTRLDTRADCIAFAGQIDRLVRVARGGTKMAAAIEFAAAQLESNTFSGLKQVIDVSGDGRCDNYDYYQENSGYDNGHGTPWDEVMTNISGQVDVVNGICITSDDGVAGFYRDVLPQGEGSFMMQVSTFAGFEDAILVKLHREIGVLPGLYD